MHLSDQGLIVILVVGLVAGWLVGKVVRGNGFGLVGDAAIGIVTFELGLAASSELASRMAKQ